jgi:nucleoside-diphosphate-sugar epimerase
MSLIERDLAHILDKTKFLWREVKGKKIFVTGGTGFIGRWLLESFAFANKELNLNASLVLLTRDPRRFEKKAKNIVADKSINLLKGDAVSFTFPKGKFDFVIHAATEDRYPLNSLELYESNVKGTQRVLDFAVRCGCKKFLFTSSGAVYGVQPINIANLPEDYPGAPKPNEINYAYGHSKRISEFYCAQYAKKFGFGVKIARCFAFLGPYLPLDLNYAVGNFIRDALTRKSIIVKTNNRVYRSYLYSADLAIWLWTILFKGENNLPYNVGSSKPITILDLAKKITRILGVSKKIVILKKGKRIKTERYIPDVKLAQTTLNLKEFIGLGQGIRRMSEFYSSATCINSGCQ